MDLHLIPIPPPTDPQGETVNHVGVGAELKKKKTVMMVNIMLCIFYYLVVANDK